MVSFKYRKIQPKKLLQGKDEADLKIGVSYLNISMVSFIPFSISIYFHLNVKHYFSSFMFHFFKILTSSKIELLVLDMILQFCPLFSSLPSFTDGIFLAA